MKQVGRSIPAFRAAGPEPGPHQQHSHLGELISRSPWDEDLIDALEPTRLLFVEEPRQELRGDLDGDTLHATASAHRTLPKSAANVLTPPVAGQEPSNTRWAVSSSPAT